MLKVGVAGLAVLNLLEVVAQQKPERIAFLFFISLAYKSQLLTPGNKKARHFHVWLFLVGVAGFEPATSASQTRRDNRATLHPELVINFNKNNIQKT